jgi:hypothetical protein
LGIPAILISWGSHQLGEAPQYQVNEQNPMIKNFQQFGAMVLAGALLVAAVPVHADTTLQQQRACQNRAANAFPNTIRNDIQVTSIRKGEDGSESLRWQLPDGTYGFCRTSNEAVLQEFGVYPGLMGVSQPSSADPNGICQRRVLQEYPTLPAESLMVSEVARSQDGTVSFKWQILNGASGFCSVAKTGEIFELGVNVE